MIVNVLNDMLFWKNAVLNVILTQMLAKILTYIIEELTIKIEDEVLKQRREKETVT